MRTITLTSTDGRGEPVALADELDHGIARHTAHHHGTAGFAPERLSRPS